MRRKCGGCTLCCTLVPVQEVDKPANTNCRYQHKRSCSVYRTSKMPECCRLWTCRWLTDDDTADLSRPDHSHMVIDVVPDFVRITDEDRQFTIPIVQVWMDPKHPEAWRTDDPFLAYVTRRSAEGVGVLIRKGNESATFLLAPTYPGNTEGTWVEKTSRLSEPQHTMKEIMETISNRR